MLGFRSAHNRNDSSTDPENRDVAKLFFDSFSKRLDVVEGDLRDLSSEFARLKLSIETGQISDLVLLERLQKSETLIKDTLNSLKLAVEKALEIERGPSRSEALESRSVEAKTVEPLAREESGIASHVLSPTGELGSLPSITTPTELQVLTLLAAEGPKSAPEIGRVVGRSREHTARLMKKLYDEGYIRRDQTRIPFRYSVVDRLKQSFKKTGAEGKEQISVPQT